MLKDIMPSFIFRSVFLDKPRHSKYLLCEEYTHLQLCKRNLSWKSGKHSNNSKGSGIPCLRGRQTLHHCLYLGQVTQDSKSGSLDINDSFLRQGDGLDSLSMAFPVLFPIKACKIKHIPITSIYNISVMFFVCKLRGRPPSTEGASRQELEQLQSYGY